MSDQKAQIDLTTPSTIENVDFAVFDWLDKQLNLSCNTKDGFKKVNVLWVTPERSFQIKNNKEIRDSSGALNLPLITLERGAINKDQKNAATYYANLPPKNDRIIISRKINQKKTSEFANADFKRKYGEVEFVKPKKPNSKIVYEYKSVLLPVYVQITYTINIFTQFQQQMNEILQPFTTKTGSTRYFLVERDGYKYECFIEPNFDTKNNVASMEEEERRYITTITIKTLANIQTDGANQDDSIIKTYENAVEIKLPRESLIIAKEEFKAPKEITKPLSANSATLVGSNVALKKVFTIGNGVDSIYRVDHNLASRDLYVVVRENFDGFSTVEVAIDYTDLNHIDIDMGDIIDLNSYVVTIIG